MKKNMNQRMTNMKNAALAALVIMTMGACGQRGNSDEKAPIVEVVTVKDQNEVSTTTFTGRTKAASEVTLAFRVSGQIERLLVKEGDYVRRGQVIAVMDNRDYQVQLAATQAEYEQIKADAERVMALYAEGNTTASNNDKARYGLQQITQKLANHKNQLADTQLRSTIDGYVQTKYHEAGETVGAGMPVISVFGSGDTEVEVKISALDFANIETFTDFNCKFDVTGEESFPLRLVRMNQEANSSQLYVVRLAFTKPVNPKVITPGMTTIVYAQHDERAAKGVVTVPSGAILRNGDKTQAFVYDAQSGTVKVRTVNVTTINRDGTMLVNSGLKGGEQVVAAGVHHLTDGQKVRLLEKPGKSNVGGLL